MKPVVLPFTDTERITGDELEAQKQWIAEYGGMDLFNEFPVAVLVLNQHRQIVFINSKARSLVSASVKNPYGMRPGEVFNCIHANETAGGCGTTTFCRFCGAAKGISSALSGALDLQECQIDRTHNHRHDQLDLLVWTKPFTTHEQIFILVALIDISAEKQRDTLERIFLHDILNTVSSIQSILHVIDEDQHNVTEYLDLAKKAAEQLNDEIQTHRTIWNAEQGNLSVNASVVSVGTLLQQVGELYNYMAEERGIRVKVEVYGEKRIISDEVLLKRVVSNLVKNAIEASHVGDVIEVRCISESDAVRIQIKNAAVISEEVQANLFKRAYSTKAKGRGWGTYAARLFVEDFLGGHISFESNSEVGTVFTITLPDDPVFPPEINS